MKQYALDSEGEKQGATRRVRIINGVDYKIIWLLENCEIEMSLHNHFRHPIALYKFDYCFILVSDVLHASLFSDSPQNDGGRNFGTGKRLFYQSRVECWKRTNNNNYHRLIRE